MLTYFARHTYQLDIDDETRRNLWESRLVAIHYPHGKDGPAEQDSESTDPRDYVKSARTAHRALRELARSVGYVCAQYSGHEKVLVGKVEPNSAVALLRGQWGSRYGNQGRVAVLKTLPRQNVRVIRPFESVAILAGRPRQGTLMRWPSVGKAVENLVEGRPTGMTVANLSTPQQEVLCSEFLRSPDAAKVGLPVLRHLLLPPGRTMKDIDVYALATDGRQICAQVTDAPLAGVAWKRERLQP